jgi:ABC-type Fe3+-citrate transport system substrate-binding protein
LDGFYTNLGITEEDDDQHLLNPYESMSMEELKKKLPAYFFMSPKKKNKYFLQLTNDYLKGLKKKKDQRPLNTKVKFHSAQEKVKSTACLN